jgi:ribose 5-phosphate isomerase A
VERGTLNVIKGRGGALLREKIVASASERLVLIADEGKLVDQLCPEQQPIPVEVETFSWKGTASRLRALGANLTRRTTATGGAFVSDGRHFILDCVFPRFDSARKIERFLNDAVGVVEHGLFIGMASEAS